MGITAARNLKKQKTSNLWHNFLQRNNDLITLTNLTLRRGARVLLDSVSLTLNPAEKIGLIGKNGAGKSSLFALFLRRLQEDSGQFSIPPHWMTAEVSQDMPETEESASDFVLAGDARLALAQQEVSEAEVSNDGERIAHAYLALQDAGSFDARARAETLILGLGFLVSDLNKAVNSFSGGWRMRLQLARALMSPSDLLLLDEPTNHLDLDALVWLEAWLKRYSGTLLMISHDREFLDAVCNVTVHIENNKLVRYGGNYSTFELLRAQQLSLQQNAYVKQQEKIGQLSAFITRFKAKASKAKQAQSRVKALERLELIAPVLADAEFSFSFKTPENLPDPMLTIQNAALGYGREIVILPKVTKTVVAGARIGILGANGQGKSTLIKSIAQDLAPLAGEINEGKGLKIGYFAQQELDVLSPEDNALTHLVRLSRKLAAEGNLPKGQGIREQDFRTFLGSFLFSGDKVAQKVGTFSGGEKARLCLALIVWQRPNLLLLDEPTNHLDLNTREALAVALNEFDGALMLVSHDRALLRMVCDEFWLVAHGQVADFAGDLDEYQQFLLAEANKKRQAEKANLNDGAPKNSAHEARKSANRLKTLKREMEKLEQKIDKLNQEKVSLENALANANKVTEIKELGEKIGALQNNLDQTEETWLATQSAMDELVDAQMA